MQASFQVCLFFNLVEIISYCCIPKINYTNMHTCILHGSIMSDVSNYVRVVQDRPVYRRLPCIISPTAVEIPCEKEPTNASDKYNIICCCGLEVHFTAENKEPFLKQRALIHCSYCSYLLFLI